MVFLIELFRRGLTPDLLVAGRSFRLHLPGEKKPELFHIESVQEHVPGVYTYTGYLGENKRLGSNARQGLDSTENYSWFSFSVKNNQLLGKINSRGYVYVIQNNGESSGDYIVSKIDPRKIQHNPGFEDGMITENTGGLSDPKSLDQFSPSTVSAMSSDDGSRNIRVHFMFTNDVDEPHLRASLIISEFRQALADSGISLPHRYITFAGLRYVGVNTTNYSCARVDIRNAMGAAHANEVIGGSPLPGNAFNGIRTWLANNQADIGFLIYQGDSGVNNYCRTGGVAYVYDPDRPVGNVADNYAIADYTALHEIGHIFDGRHFTDGPETEPNRNKGFVADDGSWQTIMGGYNDDDCEFHPYPQGPDCDRLRRFSDPLQNHNNTPLGTENHNMKAEIESPNGGFATVAGWGSSGTFGSQPLAPNPFTMTQYPYWCAYQIAQMTPRPNATSYQLYASINANFSNHSLIYSGASTTSWVFQTQTVRYYRAKACNANGCGNFTPIVTAFGC